MNNITWSTKILRVQVIDTETHNDVIARITASLIFTDGENTSHGTVVVDPDYQNADQIIPIEEVTDEMMQDWIMEGIGDHFDLMLDHHAQMLADMEKESAMRDYMVDPDYQTEEQ